MINILAVSSLIAVTGAVLLSEHWLSGNSVGVTSAILREITASCRDPTTQWMIVVSLTGYAGAFLFLERRNGKPNPQPIFSLALFLVCILARYTLSYKPMTGAVDFVVFMTALVFGKAAAAWSRWYNHRPSHESPCGHSFFGAGALPAFILIIFLAGAALWQPASMPFQYRGLQRWIGIWNNPNLYGLLMGVGVVVSGGFLVSRLEKYALPKSVRKNGDPGSLVIALLSLVAATLCGIGLFKSYSRGAWLATFLGSVYLIVQSSLFHRVSKEGGQLSVGRGLRKNAVSLSIVLLSVVVLTFWQFRFTEWTPARRAFSAANINDFSWRNRVAAWQGALRMMADKPFLGFGWGQAEAAYEKNYSPEHLENGAAIQMNDYLMIGVSAGVPALACFIMYVGFSLRTSETKGQVPMGDTDQDRPEISSPVTRPPPLPAICRAGAIVLLVGFWFDGGLFKLATGSVFWMLLELGKVEAVGDGTTRFHLNEGRSGGQPSGPTIHDSPFTIPASTWLRWPWLHWTAVVLLAVALIQTAVNLSVPNFHHNRFTLAVARHWLIPPKALADFNLLAADPLLKDQPLKIPLSHAGLANYNRELVNWQVDDATYREYVLSPIITLPVELERTRSSASPPGAPSTASARSDFEPLNPGRDALPRVRDGGELAPPSSISSLQSSIRNPQSPSNELSTIRSPLSAGLNWRRPLWEYFYPSIRRENDAQAAAEIVLTNLRKRLTIVEHGPLTVEAMWRQKSADEKGLPIIQVAALRSVGVPARLDARGEAELFADGRWHPAPH